MISLFIFGWVVSGLLGLVIGFFLFRDRPPVGDGCRCYYDGDGNRAWPGYDCPVHKKQATG